MGGPIRDREVADDERKLWRLVRESRSGENESINLIQLARGAGIHESRARQIAKTWENDGLVTTLRNGNRILLTETGESFTFE